eukprot:4411733-Amphidinium_carterae.1
MLQMYTCNVTTPTQGLKQLHNLPSVETSNAYDRWFLKSFPFLEYARTNSFSLMGALLGLAITSALLVKVHHLIWELDVNA